MGSLPKPKRIVDRNLLNSYHKMPCLVCSSIGTTVGHHIKSKGSGGDDVKSNLMNLCFIHHSEVHSIGLSGFSVKYKKVELFLINNGWTFDCGWKNHK